MNNKAELLIELNTSQNLLDIIVHQRKKKMIMRWIIGAIFYFSFWNITWIRYMFWIGLIMELLLLGFTLFSYFKLRNKIRLIQSELGLLSKSS